MIDDRTPQQLDRDKAPWREGGKGRSGGGAKQGSSSKKMQATYCAVEVMRKEQKKRNKKA